MRRTVLAVLVGSATLAGCTAGTAPVAAPGPTPEPVAPPAACVLDVPALTTATGLVWTPEETTASDTRCVYDAATGSSTDFLVVERGDAGPLETLAQACGPGSRTEAGTDGFVCRFPGGGVFAARDRDGVVLTLAAAETPVGSTPDRLVTAFAGQLDLAP